MEIPNFKSEGQRQSYWKKQRMIELQLDEQNEQKLSKAYHDVDFGVIPAARDNRSIKEIEQDTTLQMINAKKNAMTLMNNDGAEAERLLELIGKPNYISFNKHALDIIAKLQGRIGLMKSTEAYDEIKSYINVVSNMSLRVPPSKDQIEKMMAGINAKLDTNNAQVFDIIQKLQAYHAVISMGTTHPSAIVPVDEDEFEDALGELDDFVGGADGDDEDIVSTIGRITEPISLEALETMANMMTSVEQQEEDDDLPPPLETVDADEDEAETALPRPQFGAARRLRRPPVIYDTSSEEEFDEEESDEEESSQFYKKTLKPSHKIGSSKGILNDFGDELDEDDVSTVVDMYNTPEQEHPWSAETQDYQVFEGDINEMRNIFVELTEYADGTNESLDNQTAIKMRWLLALINIRPGAKTNNANIRAIYASRENQIEDFLKNVGPTGIYKEGIDSDTLRKLNDLENRLSTFQYIEFDHTAAPEDMGRTKDKKRRPADADANARLYLALYDELKGEADIYSENVTTTRGGKRTTSKVGSKSETYYKYKALQEMATGDSSRKDPKITYATLKTILNKPIYRLTADKIRENLSEPDQSLDKPEGKMGSGFHRVGRRRFQR
jgi:hypothetical protein